MVKVIVWREAEGVSQKFKGGGGGGGFCLGVCAALFMGELTPQVFYQSYLPMPASFSLKRVI